MAGEFQVDKERLQSIAQGLLDVKSKARSIDNTAEAFLPLTVDAEVIKTLRRMMELSQFLAKHASDLYLLIAREALTE